MHNLDILLPKIVNCDRAQARSWLGAYACGPTQFAVNSHVLGNWGARENSVPTRPRNGELVPTDKTERGTES